MITLKGKIKDYILTAKNDIDGVKRFVTEIIAESIEFINTKKDDGKAEEPKAEQINTFTPIEDDDLPF